MPCLCIQVTNYKESPVCHSQLYSQISKIHLVLHALTMVSFVFCCFFSFEKVSFCFMFHLSLYVKEKLIGLKSPSSYQYT